VGAAFVFFLGIGGLLDLASVFLYDTAGRWVGDTYLLSGLMRDIIVDADRRLE
jgi:ABC-type transporter lipoprotein component MlaA